MANSVMPKKKKSLAMGTKALGKVLGLSIDTFFIRTCIKLSINEYMIIDPKNWMI